MLTFRVRDHHADNLLAGATLGERHLRALLQSMPADATATSVVLIDFDGIAGATGSYLKALIVRLLTARVAAFDPKAPTPLGPNAPVTGTSHFAVYVVNVTEDVAIDLRGVLVDAGLACLEALEWDAVRVRRARRHGDLDPAVGNAFQLLLRVGAATVSKLAEAGRDQRIGTTAWHYRLGELLKLGLASRTKSERSWVYEPAAMEVVDG
jgi:hypothetical protein